MAKVTIGGKEYSLRMDLYAMEQIEDEFGSVKEAFAEMQNGAQVKATRTLFRVMANSWLSWKGEKETVTGDEIKHASMEDFASVAKAVQEAIQEAGKSETTGGGAADDEVHDVYLEEIERKN